MPGRLSRIDLFQPAAALRPAGSRLRAIAWLAIDLLIAMAATAGEPVVWKTQPAFRRQLAESIGISWQESSLAGGLSRLAETNGVAIFLDRRIDPGQPVTLKLPDQPLHAVLKKIAEAAQASVATLGPVVYVGPPSATASVATVAAVRRQDAARFSAEQKARFLRTQPWSWDELAQPRELLALLAREAGISVVNAEALPHDLWAARSLPPLPWTDRLTLLLVGFGLTFEFDERGGAVRLTPLPTSVLLEKIYTPLGDAAALAEKLRPLMPGAKLNVVEGKLVVAAGQDDHDKIERLLTGQGSSASQSVRGEKTAPGSETLYSLQVTNEPAGKVVRTVAQSLGKELKYDREVLEKLRQQVSLNVKNASLDYLLETTLKPLGLAYRVTGDALEVIPQQPQK